MTIPVTFVPPFRQLVEGTANYLAEHGVNVVVERGITPSHVKPIPGRANRVIFYSSKPNGAAGAIVGPREAGQLELGADATTDPPTPPSYSIRPLSDWSRTLYVTFWAQDIDRPNDEGAQDDAIFQLFAWVQRAVQSVAFANAVWGTTELKIPVDRAFGLELHVDLTFQHAIYDLPQEMVQPSPSILKGALP